MDCEPSNGLIARSLQQILENAHLCGELNLTKMKLKEFPNVNKNKYDLCDTTIADLSENYFTNFPEELIQFWSLESLNLHHNTIQSIPNTISSLHCLVNLNLSQNYLSSLPLALCQLPLEILLLSNNHLKQLPIEIGFCKTLIELDVSGNKLTYLPSQMGQLSSLRCLNARNNLLIELPLELTYLNLARLDVSMNQIASLPVELRLMSNLENLIVINNPLVCPPLNICIKGRIHIFKWLHIKSVRDKRTRTSFKFNSIKCKHSLDNNMESLFKTTSLVHSLEECTQESIEYEKKSLESNDYYSSEIIESNPNSNSINTNIQPQHTQSYREYKEFLKQQRIGESIYKEKNQNNNFDQKDIILYIKPEIESNPNISLMSANSNNWSKNHNITKNKLEFTMKREFNKQKEETQCIKELRNNIESRLKMTLPNDLSSALSDGIVLCYLANHVKPRSVASIHVPSPSVPKLTMARCRRNIDNFLEACRKIGINETLICCAVDILEGKNIINLAITVNELLKFHSLQ